jgi:hypothetical protein
METQKNQRPENGKDNVKIDLHVHTYLSDGYLSPSDVVYKAHCEGVSTIAITDHDTVSGLEEALNEGKKLGVDVIPGIEISARNGSSVHILGYFPGKSLEEISGIEVYLKKTQEGRTQRTYQLVGLLNQDGYEITAQEVDSLTRGVYAPKNAVVDILVKKGYVSNEKEGLKLVENKRYDVPYSSDWAMAPEDAVKLISSFGGKAVLAHPGKLMNKHDIEDFIKKLIDAGLKGIEVYSKKNSEAQRDHLADIADRYGLIKTYGTDLHRPDQMMGKIEGVDIDSGNIIDDLIK